MFILKVILVGMVALTPNPTTDGQVGLLVDVDRAAPSAPNHEAWVLLWDGRCEGDGCMRDEGPFEEFDLAWKLEGHDILLRTFRRAEGIDTVAGRDDDEALPNDADDAADISWVPAMSWFVRGSARRLDNCLEMPKTCPLDGRIWLDHGSLSTCHLAHGPDGGPVYAYRNGTKTQAIGNAVMIEMEIKGDPRMVSVHRSRFGSSVSDDALLRPRRRFFQRVQGLFGGEKPTVTLVIFNEVMDAHERDRNDMPNRHEHFKALHALLRHPGTAVPVRLPNHKTDHPPGTCEPILEALRCCIEADCGVAHTCASDVPHSASECDVATIP